MIWKARESTTSEYFYAEETTRYVLPFHSKLRSIDSFDSLHAQSEKLEEQAGSTVSGKRTENSRMVIYHSEIVRN